MFNALIILYGLFNIIAFLILIICCVCTIVGNIRINNLATAKVALPMYRDFRGAINCCFIVAMIFIIMDWLLFAGQYNGSAGRGIAIITNVALSFSVMWAIELVLLIVFEVLTKFIKTRLYTMKDAIAPAVLRTILSFVLVFIFA